MSFSRDHELNAKDEHYTPAFIFEKLGLQFEIDVCAPRGGGVVDTLSKIFHGR